MKVRKEREIEKDRERGERDEQTQRKKAGKQSSL